MIRRYVQSLHTKFVSVLQIPPLVVQQDWRCRTSAPMLLALAYLSSSPVLGTNAFDQWHAFEFYPVQFGASPIPNYRHRHPYDYANSLFQRLTDHSKKSRKFQLQENRLRLEIPV